MTNLNPGTKDTTNSVKSQVEQEILNLLNPTELRLFKYFYNFLWHNGNCAASQAYIGYRLGLSREWVNKIIGRLKRLGLIYVISQGYRKVNKYLINKKFRGFWFFDAIKSIVAKDLSTAGQEPQFTLLILDDEITNNILPTSSKVPTKSGADFVQNRTFSQVGAEVYQKKREEREKKTMDVLEWLKEQGLL